jgi:formamidopyrimidine-DNA glycosylase
VPELPEVETVARQLAPLLRGCVLRRIEVLDPLLRAARRNLPCGRVVRNVTREGKQVAILLRAHGSRRIVHRLLCHLRMTGRLLWLPRGDASRDTRHLRARLVFDRGRLLFIDPRRFGTLRVLRGACAAGSGVDPTTRAFTPPALARLLAGSRQELKPWLLRQDRLVGLGNIYASEILFAARLDPRRRAGTLGPAETRRLWRATRRVLARAIACRGTTFSDFGDAGGRPGGFQRRLAVYGREHEACRRCGRPVRRIVQQGRSTFCCTSCQQGTRPGTDVAP